MACTCDVHYLSHSTTTAWTPTAESWSLLPKYLWRWTLQTVRRGRLCEKAIRRAACSTEIVETAPTKADWQLIADDQEHDTVPWTISNKYYTAPVHFKAATIQTFSEGGLKAPAIVFVFESPSKHVRSLDDTEPMSDILYPVVD